MPIRLPVDFIWSSRGLKNVQYADDEVFEGRIGNYLGQDELGEGGQATVAVVYVKGQAVARRSMKEEGVDEEALREARLWESTVHRQIVQLVGTYVLRHSLYLLLYPIAECTLQEYIMRPIEDLDQAWEQELKQCFGCLANSVAFLHSKQIVIKHKDINPTNILMSRGTPILTDVGISNSFKDQEHSTSTGFTKRSPPYAAPEVISRTRRNTSQDIFSLWLIFLDIFWALRGKTHKRSDFDGQERVESFPGTQTDDDDSKFAGRMVKLVYEESPTFREPQTFLQILRVMTSVQLDQQPTADTIWSVITRPTFFE